MVAQAMKTSGIYHPPPPLDPIAPSGSGGGIFSLASNCQAIAARPDVEVDLPLGGAAFLVGSIRSTRA